MRTAAEGVTDRGARARRAPAARPVGRRSTALAKRVAGRRRCSTGSPTWPCGSSARSSTRSTAASSSTTRRCYEEVRDYVERDQPRARRPRRVLRPDGRGPAALRAVPRARAAAQGARPQGVAAVGRLAHHRAHRGAHRHRRQHRQERRARRTSRRRSSATTSRRPRRSPASSGCATSAGSSSSTSSTWRSGKNRDEVDRGVPRGPGPGQDPHPGVRHLRAGPGRDDPQAHRRGAARVVRRAPARTARAAASWSTTSCSAGRGRRSGARTLVGPASRKFDVAMYAVITDRWQAVPGRARASSSRSSCSAPTTATRSARARAARRRRHRARHARRSWTGATVTAKVVGEAKGPKIDGFTYKTKTQPASKRCGPPPALPADRDHRDHEGLRSAEMSKTKGGGSTRNGRDSNAQRLGVKVYDGTAVHRRHDHRPPARHQVPPRRERRPRRRRHAVRHRRRHGEVRPAQGPQARRRPPSGVARPHPSTHSGWKGR